MGEEDLALLSSSTGIYIGIRLGDAAGSIPRGLVDISGDLASGPVWCASLVQRTGSAAPLLRVLSSKAMLAHLIAKGLHLVPIFLQGLAAGTGACSDLRVVVELGA